MRSIALWVSLGVFLVLLIFDLTLLGVSIRHLGPDVLREEPPATWLQQKWWYPAAADLGSRIWRACLVVVITFWSALVGANITTTSDGEVAANWVGSGIAELVFVTVILLIAAMAKVGLHVRRHQKTVDRYTETMFGFPSGSGWWTLFDVSVIGIMYVCVQGVVLVAPWRK